MSVLVRFLVSVVIIVGGFQAGTHWSASMLSRAERGSAWRVVWGYPIYRPYQGVVWWVMADEDRFAELLPPMAVTLGGVVLGYAMLRMGRRTSRARPDERYVSGARWATRDDVKDGGLL